MDKKRKHKRSTSTSRKNVVHINAELPRNGLSRVPDVTNYFQFSRITLHRMVKEKRFPAPFRISAGLIAWDNRKLWQFIEAGGQWVEPQEEKVAA